MDYYRGNGCKWYHDCFTCPFEDCLLGKRLKPNQKKERAVAMWKEGKFVKDIAKEIGRSKRTIQRYINNFT